MPEPVVEIPNRPAFRASEVCEIAQIPPYVLKSWEKEFPNLGTTAKPGGPRVYRRADVEQVMKIKHLLFAEGLTLAGARRKLEGEPRVEEEPLLPDAAVPEEVRGKVARIRQELRSLLDLLSSPKTATPADEGAPVVEEPRAPGSWPPAVEQQGLPLLGEASETAVPPKPRRASRRPSRKGSDDGEEPRS